MTHEPFFLADKDGFRPTPACRGPWDPNSLHGRVVAGLLAYEIERQHGDATLMPARLTVDLYRLPDLSPVVVTTSVVRNGRRIKVIDAEFVSNGVSVGRATCQLLRRSENAPGRVWTPPAWDAPLPHEIAVPEAAAHGLGGMWAVRPIAGAFGTVGRKRLWMSEVRELVGGIALTPWVRAALAADFASPFANSGEAGLGYINSDITLYLTRLPRTPWIGFDVVDHHADSGVAFGECRMYDEEGPIGSSSVCALAQRRQEALKPGS